LYNEFWRFSARLRALQFLQGRYAYVSVVSN
jgi:hypothetical protein